jgi:ABC-2 type transport system permease protein
VLGAVLFASSRGGEHIDDAALLYVGLFGLGWLVLPVLLFSSDNTIDPLRFSLLPLRPRQLVQGQLVAGLISGVGLFGVLTLGAAGYAVSDSPSTIVLGAIAALLTLLLCMIASRALTTSIGGALRSRRGRDVALLGAALLGASLYPIQIAVQSFVSETGVAGVETLGRVVAWTPFGWPFAAVVDATNGSWGPAALRLVATVAVTAALLVIWSRAVAHTLEAPEHAGGAGATGTGDLAPSWIRRLLPRGPAGAVAAKELRYWWRDPRRRAAALTALLVGVGVTVFPAVSSGAGIGRPLAFAGIGPALFATMNSANQFGLDGTAIWTDLAVPGSSRHQVRGRQFAVASMVIPAVTLITVAGALISGAPASYAAAALGLCLAALGCGLAMTSAIAVLAPYPIPANPSNPFAGSTGGGFTTWLYQVTGLLAQVVMLAPVAALVIWGIVGDQPVALWLALLVGPAWGYGAARLGGMLGAGQLDRRGPELLSAVTPRGV